MIRELAAYVRANGFDVEIEGDTLFIRKDSHCYSWSLTPYRGAGYIHRDIQLNEADLTIQAIEDLICDGPQNPSTYGQSARQLWQKRRPIGSARPAQPEH